MVSTEAIFASSAATPCTAKTTKTAAAPKAVPRRNRAILRLSSVMFYYIVTFNRRVQTGKKF